MSSNVVAGVLELTGIVAHMSQRKFAPLAAFAMGVTVGELRAAGRLESDKEVADLVAQLTRELEKTSPPPHSDMA